jgi:hypothetical protein
VRNTLAYHDTELITNIKSFILEDSHDVTTFFSSEKGEKELWKEFPDLKLFCLWHHVTILINYSYSLSRNACYFYKVQNDRIVDNKGVSPASFGHQVSISPTFYEQL